MDPALYNVLVADPQLQAAVALLVANAGQMSHVSEPTQAATGETAGGAMAYREMPTMHERIAYHNQATAQQQQVEIVEPRPFLEICCAKTKRATDL